MQIHDKTHLSIRAYMKQSGWQNARLKTCPANPGGDCRLHRHGTYTRKYPDGMRVARFYCRSCQKIFSLLPTFMAAGCPGTLDEIEKVALVYEECGTLNGSLQRVRAGHGSNTRAQRRWLQHRVVAVHLLLVSFRHKGPPAHTLVSLRLQCAPWLQTLPRPVGFHRKKRPVESQSDPPTDDGHWQDGMIRSNFSP